MWNNLASAYRANRQTSFSHLITIALIIAATAFMLFALGRVPICECGYVKIWHGNVWSSENSQHIGDWYTFSHIIYGFIFYGLAKVLMLRYSLGSRLTLVVFIKAVWEIIENTDFVINRYREATISLNYYGDSIVNSVSDITAMILGFLLATRLPVWALVAIGLGLELFAAYGARDNLVLNVLMLLWPIEAVKQWQMGG
jgi:hypothetical protein